MNYKPLPQIALIILCLLAFSAADAKPSKLTKAVIDGDTKRVQRFIDRGVDLERHDKSGFTALVTAALEGQVEIAQMLLAAGVDVDRPDTLFRRTALHHAVIRDSDEMLALLLEAGADVSLLDSYSGVSPLHLLIGQNGDPDRIALLLEHGADVNVRGRLGQTPLHEGVSDDRIEAARILIARGADVNAVDEFGNTPLDIAVRNGQAATEALLLSHDATHGTPVAMPGRGCPEEWNLRKGMTYDEFKAATGLSIGMSAFSMSSMADDSVLRYAASGAVITANKDKRVLSVRCGD